MLRQAEGEFGTRGEDEARPDETRRDKTRRTSGRVEGKAGKREREGGADRERAQRVSARESEGRRVNDSGAI